MRKAIRCLWVVGGLALLGGCAVNKADCDPRAIRDAGFITKLSCDVSGSYDERIKDKQETLAATQAENTALTQALAALEQQNSQLGAKVKTTKAQRDALQRSVGTYLQQVQQSNKDNKVVQDRVAKARQKLNTLKAVPEDQVQLKQRTVDALRQELEQLERDATY